MKRQHVFRTVGLLALSLTVGAALVDAAYGQSVQGMNPGATQGAARLPADPWPRQLELNMGSVLVYQPQVSQWDGNVLQFRCAVAFKPGASGKETFGVVWASARTHVDKLARMVTLEDLQVVKSNFPTLDDKGAALAASLQASLASNAQTISLDRLEASLALSGVKPPAFAVNTAPPRIIVSYTPALLVPIDGAPVVKDVPDTRFERVINTQELIVRKKDGDSWYLHVYDGWLSAASLQGPWSQAGFTPLGLDDLAASLAKGGRVNLLDGDPNAQPKPSLNNGVPAVYVVQDQAEMILFKGDPNLVPVTGTGLLVATNTAASVFVDTASNNYFVLLAGRWFQAPGLNGPWAYVANNALPPDFARIPKNTQAGVVLASVAGTPEAQEALIANTIPQTATVPLVNGPAFVPDFDGPPQLGAIAGTSLQYVLNTPNPIIRVSDNSWYAVKDGVWFTATALTNSWTVATSVPAVIYTIPPSSPLFNVTYVRIYAATPSVVYVGYTPGYLGTVVSSDGTVVYGTGYSYQPWVGSAWYPAPYTYGIAAAPYYDPAVGFTFGFVMGATAMWLSHPYYYAGYYPGYGYHPGYYPGYYPGYGHPCCGSVSTNVYGHWGSAAYSGTRTWYSNPGGSFGTAASGSYYNQRTGTWGNYNAGRSYNPYTGTAAQGYDRSVNTPAGGQANVARGSAYNTYTGQRAYGSSTSATGAGGSSFNRDAATTAGPQGYARATQGSSYNARTGQSNTWSTASVGNNHYADVNGNVYRNTGNGWEQHSSAGWNRSSEDNSWANREAQARSAGASRWGGGDRFGGGGFGGGRFGGGFGGGFRGRR